MQNNSKLLRQPKLATALSDAAQEPERDALQRRHPLRQLQLRQVRQQCGNRQRRRAAAAAGRDGTSRQGQNKQTVKGVVEQKLYLETVGWIGKDGLMWFGWVGS